MATATKHTTSKKPGRQPTDRQPKQAKADAPQTRTVELRLAGVTNRDVVDFEEVTGFDIDDVLAGGGDDGEGRQRSYKEICALYWLALRQDDRATTFDDVLDMPLVVMRNLDVKIVGEDPEGDAAGSNG